MIGLPSNPYPEYCESGITWLGCIPASWETRRLRHILREIDVRSPAGDETHLSMSQRHGLVASSRLHEKSLQSESYAGGKLCERGDLVLNRLKAHLGVFARATENGVVSPDYAVYRLRDRHDVRYLEALMRTPQLVAELRKRTKGIVEGFWRLYTNDFFDIRIPVPPAEEQRMIADFIEAHSRLVRRYDHAKRRIQLALTEHAQSVLEHFLKRGGTPNSGAWPTIPLRRIAEVRLSGIDKHSIEGERPVCLCNYTDVYRREQIDGSIEFMQATATEAEIAAFTLKRDDVIITKDSESWTDIGVPALVIEDLPGVVCGYHLALLRPDRSQVEGKYLYRVLTAPSVAAALYVRANGVTRFGLSQHAIKSLRVPLPPLDVQREVCAAIDEAVGPLTTVRNGIEREVALMTEYRTRLVADVVLGRLDPCSALEQMDMAGDTIPEEEASQEVGEHDPESIYMGDELEGDELDELVEAES